MTTTEQKDGSIQDRKETFGKYFEKVSKHYDKF